MNTPLILSFTDYLRSDATEAVRTVVHQSSDRNVVLWQLPPHAVLPAHRHLSGSDVWVVLRGEAELVDENHSRRVIKAGDFVISGQQTVHGAISTGSSDCVLVSTVSPDIGYEAV